LGYIKSREFLDHQSDFISFLRRTQLHGVSLWSLLLVLLVELKFLDEHVFVAFADIRVSVEPSHPDDWTQRMAPLEVVRVLRVSLRLCRQMVVVVAVVESSRDRSHMQILCTTCLLCGLFPGPTSSQFYT
jgi:hypothetical protein